jgi:hypothetical protein
VRDLIGTSPENPLSPACGGEGKGEGDAVHLRPRNPPLPNPLPRDVGERGQGRAWVVFNGQSDLLWLRILRPGFRHCYVLLNEGGRWVSVDPMLNRMEIHVHNHLPDDFDLPGWLQARGQRVVPAVVDRSRTSPAPWRPFTCVEAIKRILGIHARCVLTPWQLYRHLTQPEHKKEILHHGKPVFVP